MTGRAFIISMATVVAVGIVGTLMLHSAPAPLPPKVQAAVDHDREARAVDTAEQHRLERDELAAKQRQADAALARKRLEDSVAVFRARADSLATLAATVQTSADSSSWAWRLAYEARTTEARTLQRALDSAKAETKHADTATAKADTTAAVDLRHANRADSTVTVLVDNAKDGDHCRIPGTFGLVHCPSRKAAVGAGVVIGIVGTAIVTGKIKIPVALKF